LSNNIFAIATEYLSANDYLFHHYSDSGILVNNSLPQLKYFEFSEIEDKKSKNDNLVVLFLYDGYNFNLTHCRSKKPGDFIDNIAKKLTLI